MADTAKGVSLSWGLYLIGYARLILKHNFQECFSIFFLAQNKNIIALSTLIMVSNCGLEPAFKALYKLSRPSPVF